MPSIFCLVEVIVVFLVWGFFVDFLETQFVARMILNVCLSQFGSSHLHLLIDLITLSI